MEGCEWIVEDELSDTPVCMMHVFMYGCERIVEDELSDTPAASESREGSRRGERSARGTVQGTGYRVQGKWYRVQGTGYRGEKRTGDASVLVVGEDSEGRSGGGE